jgi:LysM repeat protein/predicted nucleic acid-binding Zn ribbon protein
MAQQPISRLSAERRCPNCGTRVARDAESCFMCGHDLRIRPRRRQRVSWVDALLVIAVLAVLIVWWRLGARPPEESAAAADNRTILPTNIPILDATPTATESIAPTPTATPAGPEQVLLNHDVRSGETLLSIALQYGVTVEEIQAANNLSDELIRAGDRLTIPVLRNPSPPSAAETAPNGRVEYVVQPNDTVISIALALGSTVDAILAANNLSNNAIIRPGDRLVIPITGLPQEVIDSSASASPGETPAPAQPGGQTEIIYIEPRLLGPPDGATLARAEAVLLRWVSVEVLQPNEWYVLLIYPTTGGEQIPSIWTKATSHRLNPEVAATTGATSYRWQVSVVRVRTGANGQLTLEPASPPSQARQFIWQ